MRLDGVARAARAPDRAAEQDVVAEDEVGRQLLAHRRRVRLDPGVELVARAVLEQLDAVALVVVEHEDGKEPADVGTHDLRATEVVALGMRLLAEDRDVVPGTRPLARELARVHVRPRPAEQVPVPDQDLHAR